MSIIFVLLLALSSWAAVVRGGRRVPVSLFSSIIAVFIGIGFVAKDSKPLAKG